MKILFDMMCVSRFKIISLLLMLWVSSAYAEGGGGGGGIGGEGASGPEPHTWIFMVFAALTLGMIAIYRTRISHRDVK